MRASIPPSRQHKAGRGEVCHEPRAVRCASTRTCFLTGIERRRQLPTRPILSSRKSNGPFALAHDRERGDRLTASPSSFAQQLSFRFWLSLIQNGILPAPLRPGKPPSLIARANSGWHQKCIRELRLYGKRRKESGRWFASPRCRTTATDCKGLQMHYPALMKTDWLVVRIPPMIWGTLAILTGTVAAIATVLLLHG